VGKDYAGDGVDILLCVLCVSVPSVFYIGRLKVNAEVTETQRTQSK